MSISFIRHAEKSSCNSIHLSKKGQIRANELVKFIGSNCSITIPDVIVCMKQDTKNTSNHCYETIKPIADHYKKCILSDFTKSQIIDVSKQLIKMLKAGRHVLVCWNHIEISKIVENLTNMLHLNWGVNPESENFFHKDYTSIWRITKTEFLVFNQFTVKSNLKLDYSKVSKTPLFKYKLELHKNKGSFIYTCYSYTLRPLVSMIF